MWQPIETAPKDGTLVLLWGQPDCTDDLRFNRKNAHSGYFDEMDDAWCLSASRWDGPFIKPTHWMPLPAPPEPQLSEKK